MKRVIIVIAAFVFPLIGMGQMKKYEYTPKVKNKVEIRNLLGEISLQNSSGNVLVIESDFKMEVPDRAAGLKLIGALEDNTGIGANVSEENGIISIEGAVKQVRDYKYVISVPVGMAVNLDYSSPFAKGGLIIDSFKGSLELRSLSSDIKITKSSGPFTINTISGNLEIDFSNINQEAPTSLASINGLIDVTIPSGEKASFEISSMNGNVYNNLDLKSPKESDKRALGLNAMRGDFSLNGGGQKVFVKTISGNIYLRKR
jgi:predicted membrane protein